MTVGLTRKIKLREALGLEVRAEAFNVLNHANASSLSTSMNSPRYGKVSTALDPRIIQLGLKLAF